jgi:hypothetical protein
MTTVAVPVLMAAVPATSLAVVVTSAFATAIAAAAGPLLRRGCAGQTEHKCRRS